MRALLSLCCLPLAAWSATHDPVVVVAHAPVAIEAENTELSDGWVHEQEVPGHLGAGYLRWSAPDAYSTPGTGELRYRVLVAESARYVVRLRLNTRGASRPDLGNDAFTRFDEGPWVKTFVGGGSAEGWATRTRLEPSHGNFAEPVYELAAGLHTFAISGRSHGLRIDRIVISREDGGRPSDTIPAASGVPALPDALTDAEVRGAWLHGGLGAVLAWAERRPKDPVAADAARVLHAHADARVTEIGAWRERDALIALDLLENLAAQYHGGERGRDLVKTLRAWSAEPQVAKERKARDMAAAVDRLLADHQREQDPARKAAMAQAITEGLRVMQRSCDGTRVFTGLVRRVTAAGVAAP